MNSIEREALENQLRDDRNRAIEWATEVLADPKTVILDTETTGLHPPVDFVEIGVVDTGGRTLFHSLVKPFCEVGAGAMAVHGYHDSDLAGMPTFSHLHDALAELFDERRVVVYNAAYDRSVWDCSVEYYEILFDSTAPWECAMLAYSEFLGNWSLKHDSYTWERLPGGDHSAVGDAKACLAVVREMAEAEIV